MNAFTVVFLAALAVSVGLETWLNLRQLAHLRAHRSAVPPGFTDRVSPTAHRRGADYTIARTRLAVAATGLDAALLLGWTVGGGLDLLDRTWNALDLAAPLAGAGVIASALLLSALLRLPLAACRRFAVDARFGLNRATPRLFATDALTKGLLLAGVAAPLAALILWSMDAAGSLRWPVAWVLWTAFVVVRTWAYPGLVAPLFNRFTPLPDDGLRKRIAALLERCDLRLGEVAVMDGSRRSAHGNASVAGIGRGKRVVLLDTLVDGLDPDEIAAVLAHELGHLKRRHIAKHLAVTAVAGLGCLMLLGWLAARPGFFAGLGVGRPSPQAALALLLLSLPTLAVFAKPLLAAVSRRFEFEADAFAGRHVDPRLLARALEKLYRTNAESLSSDPIYSAFHHSHPPPLARIARLADAAPG